LVGIGAYLLLINLRLGIELTRTGCTSGPFFIPYTDPATVSGADIKNHNAIIERSVPKGTAPDDPPPIRKKLRRLRVAKRIVGNRVAVQRIFCFHA
jgi:hypothetical protein